MKKIILLAIITMTYSFGFSQSISKPTTKNGIVCLNSDQSVSFTINENGNSFDVSNEFIVQLSDYGGSFNSPIELDRIAYVVGVSTYNYSFLIEGVKSGKYRIRIASTNPNLISQESETFIIIEADDVEITANGYTDICEGEVIQLSSNAQSINTWYRVSTPNDILVSYSQNLTVHESGEYYVRNIIGSCTSESNHIIVTISTPPISIINASGPQIMCEGGTTTLISISHELDNATYQWFFNGVQIFAATSPSYVARYEGDYSLQVTNNGTCSDLSEPVRIEIIDIPIVDLGEGITGIPANANVTLSTEYNSLYQYTWYKEGDVFPLSTNYEFEITSSGYYYLYVSNYYCTRQSNRIIVSFSTKEQKLLMDDIEIVLNETKTLKVNSTHNSYKWSTGETTQQIEVNADDYGIGEHIIWVEATDSSSSYGKKYSGNGSAIITIRDEIKLVVSESLSKNGLELKDEIKLSPIPVKDILKIEIPSQNENVKIEIISSLGKVVISNTIGNNENLDVSNLPNGTYTVVVYIDNKVYRERIVKL